MTQALPVCRYRHVVAASLMTALLLFGSGCGMVKMKAMAPADYVMFKRGDVLGGVRLSAASQEMLSFIGLTESRYDKGLSACRKVLQ